MSTRQRSIADELRQAIAQAERRGLTRYRIAKMAGVDYRTTARVADGGAIPRLDVAEKIARAVGRPLTM